MLGNVDFFNLTHYVTDKAIKPVKTGLKTIKN